MKYFVGFMLGAVFFAALSVKASKVYEESIRVHYIIEQEQLAIGAKEAGDFSAALIYYTNVINMMTATEETKPEWGLLFPLAAIILEDMVQGINFSKQEGVYRANLAFVMESLGKFDEARNQYQIAARLMEISDIERLKKITVSPK